MRDDLDIIALKLLAYPGNKQLQSIRRTNVFMSKELQVKPIFADGIPRVRGQCLQHLEFALTQLQRFATEARSADRQINFKRSNSDHRLRKPLMPTGDGSQSRLQFAKVEWLDDVVICTKVKETDFVIKLIASGDDKNWGGRLAVPHIGHDLKTTSTRQVDIKNNDIEGTGKGKLLPRHTILRKRNVVAGSRELRLNGLGDVDRIFDYQDAHLADRTLTGIPEIVSSYSKGSAERETVYPFGRRNETLSCLGGLDSAGRNSFGRCIRRH